MYNLIVIIPTLNRPNVLYEITLCSLVKQSYKDFKVIVWDASDNNNTKNNVIKMKNKLNIEYIKANRRGLVSQRNDAVEYILNSEKKCSHVLFLDDDVNLSNDAIEGLIRTFSTHSDTFGFGIPIINSKISQGIYEFLKQIIRSLFFLFKFKKRHLTKYVYAYYTKPNEANGLKVNWLTGASMAYSIEVFRNISFDERLQTFGGYSLGEDILFSHKVFMNYGWMVLSDYGSLEHILYESGRLNIYNMTSSLYYNMNLIFNEINLKSNKIKKQIFKLLFFWSMLYKKIVILRKSIRQNQIGEYFQGRKRALNRIRHEKKDNSTFKE